MPRMEHEHADSAIAPATGGGAFDDLKGRLRALREAFGESQADVATVANVSRAAVSQWESGKSAPEPAKLMLLAQHYKVNYEWLQLGAGIAPNLPAPRSQRPHAPGEVRIAIDLHATPIPELDADRNWHLPISIIGEYLRSKPEMLQVWKAPTDFLPEIKRGDFLILDKSRSVEADAKGLWCVSLGEARIVMRTRYRQAPNEAPVMELVTEKADLILAAGQCKVLAKVVAVIGFL
jgi:transcriptional regulator with XRE-family HTH domain